jgi:HME family heavy-metal exporter
MTVISDASQEVRSGIVYSTMIIVLVFVPLFALPGIEGRLFAPLGVAYIISILASLLTSITLTPVLCSFLLPNAKALDHRESFIVRFLKRVNGRAVAAVLRRPGPLFATIAVGLTLALALLPTLPRTFLPPFNEGTLVVVMSLDPGISLAESSRIARTAEDILLEVPEVVRVGRRTGRSEADEHAAGVNMTDLEVALDRTKRPLALILLDIRARLATVPATFSIGQPITHRLVDHILTGTPAEIVVKIFGDDLDTLRSLAGTVETRLNGLQGITDVAVEKQAPVPQIMVQVDPARALLYGIQPGEVTRMLSQLTNGITVGEIVDGIRRYDITIRLPDWQRSTEELAALMIDTPSGQIPISYVAHVFETSGPNEVLRENGQRRIIVTANGTGTDTNLITRQVQDVIASVATPPGYFITFEGIYAEATKSAIRLAGLAFVSVMVIFAILISRYKSPVLALIIMGNVPLALIGSVFALKLTGTTLSIASMIGFITLAGISTRNGILKVSHYINLVLQEGEAFGRDLILRGAQERLVPVLMTATSAGVALCPLLFARHDAGKEMLFPVAVVIVGGLITATVLDALLTPVLFHRFGLKPLQRLAEIRTVGRPQEAY